MALLKRKTPTTYGILDDRGPVIGDCKGNFIGSEWIMNTPSIRVAIFGGVFTRDGAEDRSTAHHVTDGIPGEVLDMPLSNHLLVISQQGATKCLTQILTTSRSFDFRRRTRLTELTPSTSRLRGATRLI